METEGLGLMTISDVVEVTRLSRAFIYRIVSEGKIPTIRIGRRRLIQRSDLERFIESHRDGGPQTQG